MCANERSSPEFSPIYTTYTTMATTASHHHAAPVSHLGCHRPQATLQPYKVECSMCKYQTHINTSIKRQFQVNPLLLEKVVWTYA